MDFPKIGKNKHITDPTVPGSTDQDLSALPHHVNEIDHPTAAVWCQRGNFHRFQAVAGTDRLQCMVCSGWADAGIERPEPRLSRAAEFRKALQGKR